MHLLRCFFYYVALHNIHIKAEHVPEVMNSVADSLSHNVMQAFWQLAPNASPHPRVAENAAVIGSPGLAIASLEEIAQGLVQDSLGTSSQWENQTDQKFFFSFCASLGIPDCQRQSNCCCCMWPICHNEFAMLLPGCICRQYAICTSPRVFMIL